jgi:hypothetical protein
VGFLFAPFTFMGYTAALWVWGALMLGCFVGAGALAIEGTWTRKTILILAALATYSAFFGLILGQIISMQMLGIALAYQLMKRGKDPAAGAILALVVLMHPQGTVFIPIALLAARRFRVFKWLAIWGLGIGIFSLVALGLDGAHAYVDRILLSQKAPHLFVVSSRLSITLALRNHKMFQILVQVAFAVVGFLVVNRHRRDEVTLAVGMLASLLIVPFVHANDFMILFVGAWLLTNLRLRARDYVILAAGYLILATMTPQSVFKRGWLPIGFEIVWLLSLYFLPRPARPRISPARSLAVPRRWAIPVAAALCIAAVGGAALGAERSHEKSRVVFPHRLDGFTLSSVVEPESLVDVRHLRSQGFPAAGSATFERAGDSVRVVVARLKFGAPEDAKTSIRVIKRVMRAVLVSGYHKVNLSGDSPIQCFAASKRGGATCAWSNFRSVVIVLGSPGMSYRDVAALVAAARIRVV